jgi:hypothetical protein
LSFAPSAYAPYSLVCTFRPHIEIFPGNCEISSFKTRQGKTQEDLRIDIDDWATDSGSCQRNFPGHPSGELTKGQNAISFKT